MQSVLNLILTHQSAEDVARLICYWENYVDKQSILIAYGGTPDEFGKISYKQKFLVEDSGLRTRDHQREFQSYTAMLRQAHDFMCKEATTCRFVYFAEYDHVPLIPDLNDQQLQRLAAEAADLLAYHVYRADGTSSAHYLYHLANPDFVNFWRQITRRANPDVVLSCFGTGSFWTREAFQEVVSVVQPFPTYLELYLPTLAHHLGFRVRDMTDQNQFVRALEREIVSVDQARAKGAWSLHPVKQLLNNSCVN
jgi:hypothetical protein